MPKRTFRSVLSALGLGASRKAGVPDEARNRALSERFRQYHLGCGDILAAGFLNVDGEPQGVHWNLEPGVAHAVAGLADTYLLKHDLRHGIPAATGTLEALYHSHFLEHLNDREGRAFLAECHRCLQPGGVMRLAVPDFRLWCMNYVNDDQAFFDWYRETYLGDDHARYMTKAAVFMGMVYNWGHKMAYDFETLARLLDGLGFADVRAMAWGVSDRLADLTVLEGDSPRRFESLVVECTKPPA